MGHKEKEHIYQVGNLEHPRPDDKEFKDLVDAEVCAIEGSYDDCAWGVWDKDSGELISIVYQQQVFCS